MRGLRLELKYRIDMRRLPYLLARWGPYLLPAPHTDRNGRYPILSQYFDSPQLDFYKDKHFRIPYVLCTGKAIADR